MIKDKTEPFNSFIQGISLTVMDSKDKVDEFSCLSLDIYKDGWRHSYSVVTSFIMKNLSKEESRDVLTNFIENLNIIISSMVVIVKNLEEKRDFLSIKQYENSIQGLTRLKDHISLELIRLDYTHKIEEKVDEVNKIAEEIRERNTEIEKQIKLHNTKIEESTNETKKMKSDSVTILGIFASIMTVLAASIGLSSSIFSNMSEISSWLLCALTCLIIIFISNMLFHLFNFLREIANRNKKSSIPLLIYNCCLTLVTILCLYAHFYYIP